MTERLDSLFTKPRYDPRLRPFFNGEPLVSGFNSLFAVTRRDEGNAVNRNLRHDHASEVKTTLFQTLERNQNIVKIARTRNSR